MHTMVGPSRGVNLLPAGKVPTSSYRYPGTADPDSFAHASTLVAPTAALVAPAATVMWHRVVAPAFALVAPASHSPARSP